MVIQSFEDRREGGQRLAENLKEYAHRSDAIILALPRGGVLVAQEVAEALGLPFDVFVVRKIGVPGHPELAMGAVASHDVQYLNEEIISDLDISLNQVERVIRQEREELERREKLYRRGRPPVDLKGKVAILVDDGLATGASMLAAVQAVRSQSPKEIIAAVPVIAASSIPTIQQEVDRLVFVLAPSDFYAVGRWYSEFDQTSDAQVGEALKKRVRG
ncbi:MAG: phosphoribosyltransferase [Deltaproteobacteria bacterium]|nr:phosphoribosyltransferase [Deltaproteobacteria bacterium]MBI3295858.1 phosphoribosyltransferase [Deltaproteobacteria bacterium]